MNSWRTQHFGSLNFVHPFSTWPACVCVVLGSYKKVLSTKRWKLQGYRYIFYSPPDAYVLFLIPAPNDLRLCFPYLMKTMERLGSHVGLLNR